jgi:G3E family GTPase
VDSIRSCEVETLRYVACVGSRQFIDAQAVERYAEPEFLPWDGRRVPITFIGGYLGSGKTTLINDLLVNHGGKLAVIVNDIGEVNIDARLLRRRTGDTIELTNGCICCSALDGMGAALDALRARPEPPDHVIVELSGVADPERMLPWGASAGFRLDGLVIVVAAGQLTDTSLSDFVEGKIRTHIAAADLVVLTKCDAVEGTIVADTQHQLAELAPGVPVLLRARPAGSIAPADAVLLIGGRLREATVELPSPTLFDVHAVSSLSIPRCEDEAALRAWVRQQISVTTNGLVVRAKGIARVGEDLVLVQVVGARIDLEVLPPHEATAESDLVMISLS